MAEPTTPELPSLDAGIHLLEAEGRSTGALQSLVLDTLLVRDGPAYWVDSHGNASTASLGRIAPSRRLLDRVRVARGFTAYQHYSLVDRLRAVATSDAALVVLPDVDWFYRGDDLQGLDGGEMLAAVMNRVETVGERVDAPVLVSRSTADAFAASVREVADQVVRLERTNFGPRFVGDDFETLVYPDGRTVQTTLAYWERVLRARFDAHGLGSTEVTGVGAH